MPNTHFNFQGFDDFIEVFRAGAQTSSDGTTQIFSPADLDDMVNNHQPVPVVVGHPKTDAPAYGWSQSLKREGDILLAKFSNVEPQFAQMVADKRFPNRSVRIHKTGSGWKLAHVGWLGAAAPAIPGLKPVQFSTDSTASSSLDFISDAHATGMVVRTFRRLRDFLIENFGQEKADHVVSDFDLEMLAELAAEQRVTTNSYSQPTTDINHNEDLDVKKFTEEEVAELQRKAREEERAKAEKEFAGQNAEVTAALHQERSQRLQTEFAAHINALIDAGKLTPAQATGAVEFMAALPVSELEFSTGEGDGKAISKKSPLDWFREFTARLPKQVDMHESDAGKQTDATGQLEFHAPQGTVVSADRLALHNKAREYMNKNNCDYVEAVIACENN